MPGCQNVRICKFIPKYGPILLWPPFRLSGICRSWPMCWHIEKARCLLRQMLLSFISSRHPETWIVKCSALVAGRMRACNLPMRWNERIAAPPRRCLEWLSPPPSEPIVGLAGDQLSMHLGPTLIDRITIFYSCQDRSSPDLFEHSDYIHKGTMQVPELELHKNLHFSALMSMPWHKKTRHFRDGCWSGFVRGKGRLRWTPSGTRGPSHVA